MRGLINPMLSYYWVHAWRELGLNGARWTLTPVPGRGGAPAEKWALDGGPATVGVIASVTAPFCGQCDRLRLTADGQLRNCLFSTGEYDLLPVLRGTDAGAAADAGVEVDAGIAADAGTDAAVDAIVPRPAALPSRKARRLQAGTGLQSRPTQ